MRLSLAMQRRIDDRANRLHWAGYRRLARWISRTFCADYHQDVSRRALARYYN